MAGLILIMPLVVAFAAGAQALKLRTLRWQLRAQDDQLESHLGVDDVVSISVGRRIDSLPQLVLGSVGFPAVLFGGLVLLEQTGGLGRGELFTDVLVWAYVAAVILPLVVIEHAVPGRAFAETSEGEFVVLEVSRGRHRVAVEEEVLLRGRVEERSEVQHRWLTRRFRFRGERYVEFVRLCVDVTDQEPASEHDRP